VHEADFVEKSNKFQNFQPQNSTIFARLFARFIFVVDQDKIFNLNISATVGPCSILSLFSYLSFFCVQTGQIKRRLGPNWTKIEQRLSEHLSECRSPEVHDICPNDVCPNRLYRTTFARLSIARIVRFFVSKLD
jgi:hypothetical protein